MGFDKLIHPFNSCNKQDAEHFHHHQTFPRPFPAVLFTLIHSSYCNVWHEVWIEVYFFPSNGYPVVSAPCVKRPYFLQEVILLSCQKQLVCF